MKIILSTVVLVALLHHASAQTRLSDTRKYFKYADSSFTTDEVKRIGVYFNFDAASIRPESSVALDSLINFLKTYPNIGIEIGNHTDRHGKLEFCMTLSQARAKAICDYLVYHGISSNRLLCKGYGRSIPIYAPSDDIGRPDYLQPVRRTEVRIISISEK